MPGSIQQARYLAARAAGATMMTACAETGIPVAEARLIENDIAKGLLSLPDPVSQPKEPDMPKASKNGPVPSEELLLLIERWERLDEEKKDIAADQKDVMQEAKSRGFDTKTMREIIKLRKLTVDQRREREALLDTYMAALGMLDGTPLGKWALERLKKPEEKKPEDGEGPGGAADSEALPVADTQAEPQVTIEEARQQGRQAAKDGLSVTSNPFPAFDERRAAWDEAWCAALGSDGMDIPEALRPTPKPKKGDGEAPGPGDSEPGDSE